MKQHVVHCERGGYFLKTWIPGVSLSDLRVGLDKRITYCPIHHQSETVRRIKKQDVTTELWNKAKDQGVTDAP